MKQLSNAWKKLLDILEIHIPTLLFFILFICYMILILYRYFTRGQLQGLNEFTTIVYMWGSVTAFSYGTRTHTDVAFSLLYDKFPKKGQLVVDLISHLFLLITFFVLFFASVEYVSFMEVKKSSILKIPFSVCYGPFLIFVALVFYHTVRDLIQDFKRLFHRSEAGGEKE